MASAGLDDELWAEALKVRRSVVSWLSTLAALTIGAVIGLHFFWVLTDPSQARAIGALTQGGSVDWGRYLILALWVAIAAGFLTFVWITTWLLGMLRRRPPTTRAAVEAILIIALRWSLTEVGKVLAIGVAFVILMLVGTLMPIGSGRY